MCREEDIALGRLLLTDGSYTIEKEESEDELNGVLHLLSFFILLVGGIIYLANMDLKPNKAKSAGIVALSGLFIGFVFRVLIILSST